MQSDFKKFIACWLDLATRSGVFALPSRSEITVTEFHPFLPNMMIGKWDKDFTYSQVVYAGTAIDEAFQRDIRLSSYKTLFSDKANLATHKEIARTVVQEQMGAEVHADLCGGGHAIRLSQLRLPIAPENGEPMILSLFSYSNIDDQVIKDDMPSVSSMRYHFFEIVPKI